MKITLITFLGLVLSVNILFAQHARFVSSGTIEYEKAANTYALLKKMFSKDMEGYEQQMYDQYTKTQPQFSALKSTLTFNNDKTLFTPIVPENALRSPFGFIPMVDQNNTIYSDLATNTSIVQKNVFDDLFVVKDTIRKIKWKLTGETREIAGYSCKRANGLMLDSVYVVAFYTDKIPVSGGPESFGGLPGMILQVALPHENVTWKAVKVNDVLVSAPIVAPKKGKPVNNKQFSETIKSALKNRANDNQISLFIKSYLY